ncbi:MAG: hypothetical protein ACRDHF_05775 [Tepidiformaceae bacterium]
MTRERIILFVTIVGASGFLVFGLWAFFDARSFFDDAAEFHPYNAHFLHDIGAFQVGIGATLAVALWKRSDAIFCALLGAGIGSAFHTVAHVGDSDRGGQDSDPYVFGLFTVVLLAAAVWKVVPARKEN